MAGDLQWNSLVGEADRAFRLGVQLEKNGQASKASAAFHEVISRLIGMMRGHWVIRMIMRRHRSSAMRLKILIPDGRFRDVIVPSAQGIGTS